MIRFIIPRKLDKVIVTLLLFLTSSLSSVTEFKGKACDDDVDFGNELDDDDD